MSFDVGDSFPCSDQEVPFKLIENIVDAEKLAILHGILGNSLKMLVPGPRGL